jgi:DNA-binding MarR family transcriptional regulator
MERKYTKKERRLLEALLATGGMTAQELADALDAHKTYVLKLTKRLELEGKVTYKIDQETRRNIYIIKE